MKKSIFVIAAAAMLIPALVSCNKNNTPSGGQAPSSIAEPVNVEHQTKISFASEEASAVIDGKEVILTELELTKGSKYIIGYKEPDKKDLSPISKVGSYSIEKEAKASYGTTYKLDGVGTFTINQEGSSVNITAVIGGETYQIKGGTESRKAVTNFGLFRLAFQDWKINSVTINVSGSGIPNVSGDYKGCDLAAIAKDIKDHGVNVDEKVLNSLSGFNVTGISLSDYGTFEIDFSGKDPFKGPIESFDPTAGSFKYHFESFSENLVLAADATATLYWKTATLGLSVEGEVKYNGDKTYKAVIAFDLSPVI